MVVGQEAGLASIVHVDASRVRLDAVGIDGGRHRATGKDLGHDLVIAVGSAELRHADDGVVLDRRAAHIGVVVAVHAVVDVRALHVCGLVLLAGHVGDTVVENVTVSRTGVSTVARAGMSAVDEGLHRGDGVAGRALGGDFQAVSQGGEGGVRPAVRVRVGSVSESILLLLLLLLQLQQQQQLLLLQVLTRIHSTPGCAG
jgi:hypothetical protein